MRGRRLPLRRLIRLPAHDPRRVLGIILPGAVFDAKTLSMIEIHRPHVFLVHLEGLNTGSAAERGSAAHAQSLSDERRGDKQRPHELELHDADKTAQGTVFFPDPVSAAGRYSSRTTASFACQ